MGLCIDQVVALSFFLKKKRRFGLGGGVHIELFK